MYRPRDAVAALGFILTTLTPAQLLARDDGRFADTPLKAWFESLRNKAGFYCCSKADGHPLDDGDGDMKDNNDRVFLQGVWAVVPNDTVILGPNKFGKAIGWFQHQGELAWGGDTSTPILCFIPGSGV
jgi:hypothetical protein